VSRRLLLQAGVNPGQSSSHSLDLDQIDPRFGEVDVAVGQATWRLLIFLGLVLPERKQCAYMSTRHFVRRLMANLHVVCAHCDTVNRLPETRLGHGGKCGRCGQPLLGGAPVELSGPQAAIHLNRSDLPLLVDFWAPWCGPCRAMAPVLARAAAALEPGMRIVKIDIDQAPELAQAYGIRAVPTLVLVQRGKELGRLAGAQDLAALLAWARRVAGPAGSFAAAG
jgi:thioredoxin 2